MIFAIAGICKKWTVSIIGVEMRLNCVLWIGYICEGGADVVLDEYVQNR